MLRLFRIIVSVLLSAGLLWMATEAAADCATGPYSSENCLWLHVRRRFHLPESRLLRTGALEMAGLAILAALFLTFRYIFPGRAAARNP